MLVYCDTFLTTELTNLGSSTLLVDHKVDPDTLRHLDSKVDGSYRVVVA